MVWVKKGNDMFTVKSVYKLALDLHTAPVEEAESSGAGRKGRLCERGCGSCQLNRNLKK